MYTNSCSAPPPYTSAVSSCLPLGREGRGFCLPLHRWQTEAQNKRLVGVGQDSPIPYSSLPSFLRPLLRSTWLSWGQGGFFCTGKWSTLSCHSHQLSCAPGSRDPGAMCGQGAVQSWVLIWSQPECLAVIQSIFPQSVTALDKSDDADGPCGCGGPLMPVFPSPFCSGKQSLGTCSGPGTVLGTEDTAVNEADYPMLVEFPF